MAVTVEGISQEVAGEQDKELQFFLLGVFVHLYEDVRACVCMGVHTAWTGSAACRRLRGSWR